MILLEIAAGTSAGYQVPDTGVKLLNPAMVSGIMIGILTTAILFAACKFDRQTHGFLTISILIVLGFITACFGAMIYAIPTNPATEILVGAMATALGAVVSQWIGRMKLHPLEPVDTEPPAPAERPPPRPPIPHDEDPSRRNDQ